LYYRPQALKITNMRKSSRRVWFLVLPRTGVLGLAGPWEVLGHTNDLLGREAYQMEAMGFGTPTSRTRHGLVVGGLRPLPARTDRLPDIAIVTGAPVNPLPGEQTATIAWLRRHQHRIPTIVSICTGAFALGGAGILDGRRATTHWLHLGELRRRFPAVEVVDDGIYVKDGHVWTSAGITAGIDLTLAMVEEHHGHRVAMDVAKRMVLFLRRSGHQAQFSSALRRQEKEPAKDRDIAAFILDHLDESLPVARLASSSGMSARTFTRWCREHLDESPAEIVRRLRLDEAKRLLEETSLPLKDISLRTGLGDPSTMWRAFAEYTGITPGAYRQRFAAAAARQS
jgi:transcriptional regulator GlxA family with amidase domain